MTKAIRKNFSQYIFGGAARATLLLLIFALLLRIFPDSLRSPARADENDGESAAAYRLKLAYSLSMAQPKDHLFVARIRVADNRANTLDFAMPAWSPGRYVIYNFARNVQEFSAKSGNGSALAWQKIDKQTWRVDCHGANVVEIDYKVFANDLSGTFSQLNDTHANINGASIFMYVDGHKQDAIDLKIEKPTSWKLMSGAADDADQSEFHFNNYDLLIDTPVEMGNFDLSTFELDGHTYRIALHALMPFHNKDLLLKELPRIVQAETAIFGPPECDKYTFLIHLVPTAQATDGMEHLNSTQIIEDSYDDLLATAAHEFFHLWNVKRIRPAGLGPWDYTREVYTKDLWICEGLTSYYGDLSLTRAGLWSHPRYYQEIAQEIAELQQRPGRKFMSLELSSWDSWLFLATPRAQLTNHDNTTISYYNKGEIVGLMLDLELRERTMNRKSLDDVFRFMYAEYYQHAKKESYYLQGEAYAPGDFLRAVERVSGADFSAFFRAYISGTEEINYNTFLGYAGLKLEENRNKDGAYQITEIPHANAQQLAIRNSWLNNQPVRANK